MPILTSTRRYRDGPQLLEGFLAKPKSLRKEDCLPAVIIFPTMMGVTAFERKRAKFMAKHGLVGFVADLYGSHIRNETKDEGANCMRVYLENRNTLLISRLRAALLFVSSLPFVNKQRIGAIGFGFGGMAVLDAARNNLAIRCGVIFHGMLSPMRDYELTEPITAKLLILQGDLDSSNAKEVDQLLQELRERHADFQLVRYSEAEEDFAIPNASSPNTSPGSSYNPTAARRSTDLMLSLFAETLGVPRAPHRLSLPKHLRPIGGQ